MNVIGDLNAAKDIQIRIKECGFAIGSTDGKLGKNTRNALNEIFEHHLRFYPKTGCVIIGSDNKTVIKEMQVNLAVAGLYDGAIDGISGKKTLAGFKSVTRQYIIDKGRTLYNICWSGHSKVSPEFVNAVVLGCQLRNWHSDSPDWLMACMSYETANTFNPQIRNKAGANFWGLIQFGEQAAKDLKVPLEEIKAMDQLTQLGVVFKYFEMWEKRGKRFNQLEDFYLSIFYPAAVGKKSDEVIATVGSKVYTQNAGFDKRGNNDGKITVGEICSEIYSMYYTGMEPSNRVLF